MLYSMAIKFILALHLMKINYLMYKDLENFHLF